MSVFRQLMMRKKGIPAIYKVLDWIQSSGTQYIDTGFVANQDTYFEMTFSVDNLNDNYYFCGGGYAWQNNIFAMTKTSASNTNINFVYGNSATLFNGFSANTKYRAIMNKNNFYIYEGTNTSPSYTGSLTYQTLSTDENFRLFTVNYTVISGAPLRPAPMKLYSAILKDNGTIVRNLIPVRRLTDNVCGMYDTVSKTFFGNAGTGAFVGSDEIPLTVVGSPTITDGVVSGFSNSNYLMTPTINRQTTWTQVLCFTTPASINLMKSKGIYQEYTNTEYRTRNSIDQNNGIGLKNFMTNTGSGWNIGSETVDDVFSLSTTYYLKTEFTGTQYITSIKTTGDYTTLSVFNSTEKWRNLPLIIGSKIDSSLDEGFKGTFNIKESYMILDGTKYIFTIGV